MLVFEIFATLGWKVKIIDFQVLSTSVSVYFSASLSVTWMFVTHSKATRERSEDFEKRAHFGRQSLVFCCFLKTEFFKLSTLKPHNSGQFYS